MGLENGDGDLLKQLRIGRDQREDESGRPPRWPWIAGAIVLLLIAAGVAFYALRGSAVEVQAATAVAPAADSDAGAVLQATGYVVARREATVSAQITGTLTEVLVEEGEHVKKGQILARLDDSGYRAALDAAKAQYAAAQAQVGQARAQLEQAQHDAKRLESVAARGLVSKQQAEQARTQAVTAQATLLAARKDAQAAAAQVASAQVNFDYCVVRAPFDGVITDKAAQVGEIVSPFSAGGGFTRTGVATIVDMDSLEVDVDVNEAYIGRVQPDMPVEAILDAYPDWRIPAHVIAIIPSADRSKATVKVRIAFDQKDPRIIPEMGVRVSFLEKRAANAKPIAGVLVPKSAIVQRDGHDVVFVIEGDHAKQTPVATGADFNDLKQVTSGLSAGAQVVSAPTAQLADGSKVKVVTGSNG
ncbi:MAG TPA: efflux RND transporter periplasmic adaptor subunit [Rhodanobacteraceae bacterium]|jgi:RND family efflux transporter MFP subunit|nr:efflux RND transporter periplasmic adaptor subunit [Rhodanobacteraceae bacterium]